MKLTQKLSLFLFPLLLLGAGCNVTSNADQDQLQGDDQIQDDAVVNIDDGEETMITEEDQVGDVEEDAVPDTKTNKESAAPEKEVEATEQAPEAVTFNVDGFMFGYSEKELRVKKGQTVTINFTSSNGLHDWVVDEFQVASNRINTGEKTSVTFLADQVGSFAYYCSVGSHRANGMVGTLIVE